MRYCDYYPRFTLFIIVPHVENHRHRMLTTLAKPFHPVSMLILSLRKPRPPSNQVALGSDEDGHIQEKDKEAR